MAKNEEEFAHAASTLQVGVNAAADQGLLLTVYPTIEQHRHDRLLKQVSNLAQPLLGGSKNEVKDLFTRSFNPDDPAWASIKELELGIIAFKGKNAGDIAQQVRRMGGNVAMIDGIEPPVVEAPVDWEAEGLRKHLRRHLKRKAIKNATVETRADMARLDAEPIYLMESPFANLIDEKSRPFEYNRGVFGSTIFKNTLEGTIGRRMNSKSGPSVLRL